MPPKVSARLFRFFGNLWPAMRGTGGTIVHIARDWTEIRIRLPLSIRTRNYVGTIFGGAMYSACDPWFMLMLIHLLGDGYVVWDKAGAIQYRKPGRGTLTATFRIPPGELEAIRQALADTDRTERSYSAELVDADGVVHAVIEKRIHIRRRRTDEPAQ